MSQTVTETLKTYYDKLFQDGYLVIAHISKWSMGTQLNKDDLKLDNDIPKLFKLGKKMLIDPKHLNSFTSIEGKARRYLYNNSYKFHIAEAHFVPKKKLLDVLDKLDQYKFEFEELAADFIENYPTYQEEILAEYPDIAHLLRPLYPTQEALKGKFSFRSETFEISMPREFAQVNVKELIEREQAEDEVKKEINARLQQQYESSLEQIQTFVDEAAQALRSQIGAVCDKLAQRIKNKEIISTANIDKIRQEIANFRSLNFLNDKVVEDKINFLDEFIERGHDYKTDEAAVTILREALDDVLSTVNNVTDIPVIRGEYLRSIKI